MGIFKACDIRGEYGTELTVEHASALGRALAHLTGLANIVVGGDGRLSTPALKAALVDALVECGVTVLDIGMVPTPAFYFARKHLGVRAGVMVTASHNPAPDNGFKLALGDLPITERELADIRRVMEAPPTPPPSATAEQCAHPRPEGVWPQAPQTGDSSSGVWPQAPQTGDSSSGVWPQAPQTGHSSSGVWPQAPQTGDSSSGGPAEPGGSRQSGKYVSTPILDCYARFVTSAAGPGARGDGATIVLDCANGMLGLIAPATFAGLGWRAVPLFAKVDGRFPGHPPNPAVAANLDALRSAVVEHGAALGVGYDGDGDRTMFVDERGGLVSCDEAIVLFARAAVLARPGAGIVYDQKCSDVVREETLRAGGVPRIERSGYTFIKTTLLTEGAAYAGEASGHHFFADIDGDDGLLASLRMAAILRASGRPFSELVASIPKYCITPDLRLPVAPGETDAILADLRRNLGARAELSELDGVRAQFADGWGLARPSVTEPVLTVRMEGHTPEALTRVRDEFVRAAPALAGRL